MMLISLDNALAWLRYQLSDAKLVTNWVGFDIPHLNKLLIVEQAFPTLLSEPRPARREPWIEGMPHWEPRSGIEALDHPVQTSQH